MKAKVSSDEEDCEVLTGPVLKAPKIEENVVVTLAYHEMSTNEREESYACDDCNYRASRAHDLKMHRRIHTDGTKEESLMLGHQEAENDPQPRAPPKKCINGEHIPDQTDGKSGGQRKRLRCRNCSKEQIRQQTYFYCPGCPGKPGLCIPNCFREYHRSQGFQIL